MAFNKPQSRNEAILQNMLGANNELEPPKSRIEYLLQQILENGGGGGQSAIHVKGVTTTALTDGCDTNPITINGESYTAVEGDLVAYQSKEFLFNGTIWQELGDVSEVMTIIENILKDIAQEFDATVSYAVNDYVLKDGVLYKCTTAHTGAWDANDFTATTISDEIADVADAVDDIKDGTDIDSFADVETALATKADLTDLAPAFSTATAYAVGQYVSYDGNVYKCTSAHSAGAWAAGDFTLVAVGSELESKQDKLTFDDVPTDNSNNPVKSNGIYDALADKANTDIVASDFDATASYTAGNYCIYEGKFYKFKASHSGAWSAADVDEIKIAGELSSLKSGFTNLDNEVNGDATVYPYADVITINDAVPANLADCSVKIEPVQDLHGYDKPWVGGAGKNICPEFIRVNINNRIPIADANGTHYGCTQKINCQSGQVLYGIYFNQGTASLNVCLVFYDVNNNFISELYATKTNGVTVPENASYFYARSWSTYDSYGDDPKLVVTTDSTVDKYYPYENICPISGHTEASVEVTDGDETTQTYTIALGDTIYGGTVDFDSGVMTPSWKSVNLGSYYWGKVNNEFFCAEITDFKQGPSVSGVRFGNIICSDYDGTDHSVIRLYFEEWRSFYRLFITDPTKADMTESEFKAAMDGVQLCYELATPTTIQLTPQQIQLLKGQNTLTASTGDISVTVNGVSGSIGAVQEQVNDLQGQIDDVNESIIGEVDTTSVEGVSFLKVGRIVVMMASSWHTTFTVPTKYRPVIDAYFVTRSMQGGASNDKITTMAIGTGGSIVLSENNTFIGSFTWIAGNAD